MVTVPPNLLIATITDRMPAVLPESNWGAWLGETGASLAEIKAFLRPIEDDWKMTEQLPKSAGSRPAGPTLF